MLSELNTHISDSILGAYRRLRKRGKENNSNSQLDFLTVPDLCMYMSVRGG